MTTFPVSTRAHAPQAICKTRVGGGGGQTQIKDKKSCTWSSNCIPPRTTYNVSSGEDDGKAEGRDDDARREEDGQLLAGIAGRVRVIHDSPGDAVRDRGEDVEEEEEQRPVFAADTGKIQINPHTRGLRQLRGVHAMTPM